MSEPIMSDPYDGEPVVLPEDEADLPLPDPAAQLWWDDEEE
jgi:hypothetical protein